jgi:hypothetical protein
MTYSLREDFYHILIRNRLGHGIKTRLVRITRQGLVQVKGGPHWDIAPPIWETKYTMAALIADIEGTLELEGGYIAEFKGDRRYRSTRTHSRLGRRIGRSA